MKASTFILTAGACALLSLTQTSSAQLLFSDNFDAGNSVQSWNTNASSSGGFANYAFDYSTLGIPAAPNSNGTTIGLGFLVNQTEGVFQGLSASPIGLEIKGDFKIEFNLWVNFIGPLPLGGTGSTQLATMGWGSAGNTAEWTSTSRGVLFAGSGDGQNALDYRAYVNADTGVMLKPESGVYAAGTGTNPDPRSELHPYYSVLGGKTVPAAQTNLYPDQNGTTAAGALGMAWRDVIIQRSGDTVTWTVDGLLIASVSIAGQTLGGENFHLGMADVNASSAGNANNAFLNTAIFDNIRVTTIPEPSSAMLIGCSALVLMRRRRLAR